MRGVSYSSRVSIEINDLLIICELATSKFGLPTFVPRTLAAFGPGSGHARHCPA